MGQTTRRILLVLTAVAVGISFPYLIMLARHALDVEPEPVVAVPLGGLSATQRLEFACEAVKRLNNKVNGVDSNRPSFLSDFKQYQKVRPELQNVRRLVCGS
jgi:hypothetical protein